MALNLEKQLRFYGAYHHNPVNISIHEVCVPIILLTAFLLCIDITPIRVNADEGQCTNTPSLIPLPESLTIPYLPPNLGTIVCLIYASLYILMEPVAGTALSVLLLMGTAAGKYLTTNYSPEANYWAMGLHIVSWIAQFIGHGKFEGRAPALLDNLFQAFFLAPLFVWLEILFSMGYREELRNRIGKGVEEDIAKFKASKAKANGNGNANGHVKTS